MRGLKKYFSIIVSIMLLLLVIGCNGSPGVYKTVVVKSELCYYSFEYSGNYEKDGPRTELDRTIPYTVLYLVAPAINETAEVLDRNSGKIETVVGKRSPAGFTFDVYNPVKYESAPQTSQERIERTIVGNQSWENFSLLERSSISVSGIKGEIITYLVDRLMPIPVENGKKLEYVRAVYFDYDGLLWVIEVKCKEEISQQVKADFDHIIQSFKILE
jgi:hypothetical protein